MDLYTDSDAPSLDRGVVSRLRRLDPRLAVTWSKWDINPLTTRPMIYKGNAIRLPEPRWHLWSRDSDGRWRYVQSYLHFGQEQVMRLEGDVARRFTISEVIDGFERARQDAKERKERAIEDRRRGIRENNKSRIRDLVFEGKSGLRTRRIMSAPGVSCTTPDQPFLADPKEDGWDLPEEGE